MSWTELKRIPMKNGVNHQQLHQRLKSLLKNLPDSRISPNLRLVQEQKPAAAPSKSGLGPFSVLALRQMTRPEKHLTKTEHQNRRHSLREGNIMSVSPSLTEAALIRMVKPLKIKNRKPFKDSGICYPQVRDLGRQAFILYRSGNTVAYNNFYNNKIKPISSDPTGDKSIRRRLFRLIIHIKDGSISSQEQIDGCPLPGSFSLSKSKAWGRLRQQPTEQPARPPRRIMNKTATSRRHRFGHPIYVASPKSHKVKTFAHW